MQTGTQSSSRHRGGGTVTTVQHARIQPPADADIPDNGKRVQTNAKRHHTSTERFRRDRSKTTTIIVVCAHLVAEKIGSETQSGECVILSGMRYHRYCTVARSTSTCGSTLPATVYTDEKSVYGSVSTL